MIAALLLAALQAAAPAEADRPPLPSYEGQVHELGLRIIDGDTFAVGEERVRIRRMDAPELHGACHAERLLAVIAKRELERILSGVYVRIEPVARDSYGRLVAEVTVWEDSLEDHIYEDTAEGEPWPPAKLGRPLAEILIAAGVARKRKSSWCAPTDAPD